MSQLPANNCSNTVFQCFYCFTVFFFENPPPLFHSHHLLLFRKVPWLIHFKQIVNTDIEHVCHFNKCCTGYGTYPIQPVIVRFIWNAYFICKLLFCQSIPCTFCFYCTINHTFHLQLLVLRIYICIIFSFRVFVNTHSANYFSFCVILDWHSEKYVIVWVHKGGD